MLLRRFEEDDEMQDLVVGALDSFSLESVSACLLDTECEQSADDYRTHPEKECRVQGTRTFNCEIIR